MTTETRETIDHLDANTVQSVTGCGRLIAVPAGHRIEDLEQYQENPNRRRDDLTLSDVPSLADYLGRFEQEHSVAFSSATRREIEVVIDYHNHLTGEPMFREHRATYKAAFDPNYKKWRDLSGQSLSQRQAGDFLEERALDVIDPDAASIMEMVMTFDALKKVTFRQSDRIQGGQRQLTYNEETEVRGAVILPESMTIKTAIFDGGEPEEIKLMIRYNIDEGRLQFRFTIHNIDAVERAGFERCEADLQAARPDLLILHTP